MLLRPLPSRCPRVWEEEAAARVQGVLEVTATKEAERISGAGGEVSPVGWSKACWQG